jgi:hypothetical protein
VSPDDYPSPPLLKLTVTDSGFLLQVKASPSNMTFIMLGPLAFVVKLL